MWIVKSGLNAIMLLAVTFIAALPWEVAPSFRLLLPMLPVVVIHLLIARAGAAGDEALPDWLVFLAGCLTDVLGQGPLGYWALVYLIAYTALRSSLFRKANGTLAHVALFVMLVASLAVVQWGLASLYYLRVMDVAPLVTAAAVATLIDAVLLALLGTNRTVPVAINRQFERGG